MEIKELLGKEIDCEDNRLSNFKIKVKGIGGGWIAGPTFKCKLIILAYSYDTIWCKQIQNQW